VKTEALKCSQSEHTQLWGGWNKGREETKEKPGGVRPLIRDGKERESFLMPCEPGRGEVRISKNELRCRGSR